MKTDAFTIDCTGDVVQGDTVLFTEAVFGGSRRRPTVLGKRRVIAEIVRDSYGQVKQQHTFTVRVIDSDGYDPLTPGRQTTRKGRNIYRYGTWRRPWADENDRRQELTFKHARGETARAERDMRRGDAL